MDIKSILGEIIARINPAPAVAVQVRPSGYGGLFAAHKDYAVHISEGPRLPHPAHTFSSIEDFAGWCAREATEGRWGPRRADVLVSPGAVVACAEPYAQHPAMASCALGPHPYWAGWKRLVERGWIASEDLFEALRELEPSFGTETVTVSGEKRQIEVGPQVLAGLKQLGVSDGGEIAVERDGGGMARTIAKNAKTVTSQQLRERWPLHMPVYDAAPDLAVDLEALVSWRYDREASDLAFRVRLPLSAIAERQARDLVVARLRELMPGFLVGAGSLAVVAPRLD